MGKPLKSPPVYFTLAQVRFSAVLKLPDYLPTIQEGLRKAGFPDFGTQKLVVLQIGEQDGKPVPAPVFQDRFSFGNAEKTHAFFLDSGSITLQSTSYGHFEKFLGIFLQGLRIAHDAMGLSITERIGLRYLDRVMPRKEDTLEKYLAPEVLGLSKRLRGNPVHSYSETLTESDHVQLRSRVVIHDGALAFPPDLQPGSLAVQERFVKYEGLSAILDNDGFYDRKDPFSLDAIEKVMHVLHGAISNAFEVVATDYARKVWDE